MDILDRQDICICPWTEYFIGPSHLSTCSWNQIKFSRPLGRPFVSGPWAGELSLDDQFLVEQRKEMLEHGMSNCPDSCPHKYLSPTVQQQLGKFRLGEKYDGIIDAIVQDMRSGVFRASKPTSIALVPTLVCNQRCSFCLQDVDTLIEQGLALKATADQLKNIQPLYDDCYYFRTTGGDTFASSDEEIEMMYAPFAERQASKIVNTNLRGLTLERYEKFVVQKEMINDVCMSLATLNPARYQQLYCGSVLEPIMKNLKEISTKYPDHKIKSLAVVVMSVNFEEIPDMLLFAERYGIGRILFLPLRTWNLKKRGLLYLDIQEAGFSEYIYKKFQEMKERLTEVRKSCHVDFGGLEYIDKVMEERLRR